MCSGFCLDNQAEIILEEGFANTPLNGIASDYHTSCMVDPETRGLPREKDWEASVRHHLGTLTGAPLHWVP